MPHLVKKKPYEFLPKDRVHLNFDGQPFVASIDRIIVQTREIVDVIYNGGRLYACGRHQEFDVETV